MTRRFGSVLGLVSTLACAGGLALNMGAASASAGASAAATLPTLNLKLTGAKSISVSGSTVSGAVSVVSTFSGHGQSAAGLVRLKPGVTVQQAFQAVNSHRGDLNALTPLGTLLFDADAPSVTQTVLTPGNYVALNLGNNSNQPAFKQFTVTSSSSPAALPAAKASQSAIEFGFKGPSVLRDGTMVRSRDAGYLVHMISMAGVRNKSTGRALMILLRAGKDRAAQKLSNGHFFDLMGPASPGALQQTVLKAKPGYYVEACFMDTQDGREHTRLGMERLIRVVK